MCRFTAFSLYIVVGDSIKFADSPRCELAAGPFPPVLVLCPLLWSFFNMSNYFFKSDERLSYPIIVFTAHLVLLSYVVNVDLNFLFLLQFGLDSSYFANNLLTAGKVVGFCCSHILNTESIFAYTRRGFTVSSSLKMVSIQSEYRSGIVYLLLIDGNPCCTLFEATSFLHIRRRHDSTYDLILWTFGM